NAEPLGYRGLQFAASQRFADLLNETIRVFRGGRAFAVDVLKPPAGPMRQRVLHVVGLGAPIDVSGIDAAEMAGPASMARFVLGRGLLALHDCREVDVRADPS